MTGPAARLALAFDFDATDLAANRRGELSPRQRAIRQTGRIAMRLAFAVFAIVLLGAAGLVAVPALPGASAGTASGSVWAVAVAAIAIGWLVARPALAGARGRTIRVARGRAEPAPPEAGPRGRRVCIGATVLPVLTDEQLAAFVPGVDYRVWYLEGSPVPTILSAEATGAPPLSPTAPAPAIPTDAPTAPDHRLRTIRRGMLLVVAIGALALAIPVLGAAADRWAAPWRAVLWLALLAVAIGLAPFARRWLAPGNRGPGDH
jgi:hypothetical protein